MKKISRRILTLLMAVLMVAATFVPAFADTTVAVDDEHDHDHEHESVECAHENHEPDGDPVESTCTTFGYTRYHCLDCGKYYLGDFQPLKEHDYETVVVNEADCQHKKVTAEQCKNCHVTKEGSRVESEELGDHRYDVTTPATCTTSGEKECSVCGDVQVIPAGGGHDFEVTDATCTKAGQKKCKNCDYDVEVIPAKGHKFKADIEHAVLPSACKPGKMSYVCETCGATYDVVIAPEADHGVEEDVPAKAPTCTEPGYTAGKKCTVCGEITSGCEPISATGHTSAEIPAVEPTCVTPGKTKGEKCSVCGEILKAQEEVPATGSHTYGDFTITVPATCKKAGEKVHSCTVCGYVETVEIPVLEGHDFVTTGTVAATCTTYGYTLKYCKLCGLKVESDLVAPLKHDWKKQDEVAATCKQPGLSGESKECIRCGAREDVVIPRLPHTPDEGVTIQEVTCTEDGKVKYTCKVCETEWIATVAALGHNVEEKVVDATCKEGGYAYRGCTRCDYVEGDRYNETPIDPNGHVLGNIVVIREATCTTEGETLSYCTLCDEKDIRTYLPKNDNHDWEVLTEATCTTEGSKKCKLCGTTAKIDALGHEPAEAEATCDAPQLCDRCGEVVKAALGHDWKNVKVITAATCTATGEADQKCERCGLEQKNTLPALGHEWDNGVVTVEPTCTEAGTKHFTCTREGCEGTKDEAVAALGHDWAGEWLPGVAATCAATGTEYRKCSRCDIAGTAADGDKAFRTTAKDPRNHTPKKNDEGEILILAVIRPASCSVTPAYKCVCVDCGMEFALIGDEDEKLPHSYGDWETVTPANCTEDGLKKRVCETCGYVDEEVIPATGHALTEVAAVAATCTAEGHVAYWTCANECCKDKYFDADGNEIADIVTKKIPHTLRKWEATESTCTAEGNIEYWECTACGKYFADDKAEKELELKDTVVAKKAHDYADATCETPATCKNCGATEGEALGHDYVEVARKDATCLEDGMMEHFTCTRCDKIFKENDDGEKVVTTADDLKLDATGHTIEEVVVEATCTTFGYTYYYCTDCKEVLNLAADPAKVNVWDKDMNGKYGASIDNIVPELGHDYSVEYNYKDPTCTEDGAKGTKCSRCGDWKKNDDGIVITTVIEKTGHKNADGIVLVDGWTCSDVIAAMGEGNIDDFDVVCANCSKEITFTHVDLTKETVYAGVCADDEDPSSGYDYTIERCAGCNKNSADVLRRNVHNYVEKEIPATCTETGKSWKECTTVIHVSDTETKVCGHKIDETELAIDADAHKWKEPVTIPATCDDNAKLHYVCAHDETHTKDEDIENTKLEHEEVLSEERSTPATYANDGENVYVCRLCEKVLRKEVVPKLTGLKVSYSVKNPNGGNFVNSGFVDLEIRLDASDIDVAVFELNFKFDANVLELIDPEGNGVAYTAGEGANAFDYTRVTSVDSQDAKDGICKIASYNGTGSAKLNGEGVLYAVIHFRVLPSAYVNGDRLSTTITPTDIVCETEENETEIKTVNGTAQTINIVKLGDMSGDGKINVSDIRLINNIINANKDAEEPKYCAEADLNKDGVVDYEDLKLLEEIMFDSTYDDVVSEVQE